MAARTQMFHARLADRGDGAGAGARRWGDDLADASAALAPGDPRNRRCAGSGQLPRPRENSIPRASSAIRSWKNMRWGKVKDEETSLK